MTFDLTTIYHKDRPLSWSAISSFEWNKDQWYRKYILKELSEKTPELEFGSKIDLLLQDDPKFLPQIIRYPIMQHTMRATFNGIPLIGIADTYRACDGLIGRGRNQIAITKNAVAIRDYKTGRKPWDQKRANETGQLTLYCFFQWLEHKIKPTDVELYIDWMPTHYVDKEIHFVEPVEVLSFQTKRTMHQVLTFGQRINDTWAAMEEYADRRSAAPIHVRVKNPVSKMFR